MRDRKEVADQVADLEMRRAGVLHKLASMTEAERNGADGRRLQRALAAFDAEIIELGGARGEDV